ncbi:MAG: prepilin-type N-terminal cleavage/methylation domain-containing protein [Patescibacteria group bacterium]
MKKKRKGFLRGFTLIELLVVISIIGVLSTFLTVNFLGTRARTRDAQRKADMQQIRSAIEIYRSDQGSYPTTLPACNSALRVGTTTYMQKVPCDPTNTTPLTYRFTSTGTTYTLAACLENINDAQKDVTNVTPCNGTSSWSYTLTNP